MLFCCVADYELDEDEQEDEGGMVQSVLLPGVRVPSAPAPADGPKARRKLQACQLFASSMASGNCMCRVVAAAAAATAATSWHIGRSLVRSVMPATNRSG
jgi:hypothetical protein